MTLGLNLGEDLRGKHLIAGFQCVSRPLDSRLNPRLIENRLVAVSFL
jgi:hypothetical protein